MEMPAKKRRRINKERHIPEVLIEKILLNLPIKSLFRFSTVAKPWNSIIFGSKFARSYRGREMMVLRCYSDEKALVCPVSSLSSEKPLDRATPFARPFEAHMIFLSVKGEFVRGKFHWRVRTLGFDDNKGKHCFKKFILSFDLLTEEYGELKLPKVPKSLFRNECRSRRWDMFASGGKLRVCLNYGCHTRFAVWVYDDDQEPESWSWTKELDIDYGHIHPLCYTYLKPFYFYDSGGNEMKGVVSSMDMRKMFVCEDGSTLVEKNFGGNGCGMFDTYVESFVLFRHDHAQTESN